MKRVRTLLAAALAVGLAFLAIRLDGGDAAEAGAARAPLVAAGSIEPESLASVELEREGVVHRFARRDGAWWQIEPVEHPVDGWSMRQFASRVLKVESVRSVPLSGDEAARTEALRAAGFDPPVGRIRLVDEPAGAAPRSVEIELGRRSLAGRAYARIVGSATGGYEVVDATLHEYALERDPREFRRRDLFPDLTEVDRLDFASGANRLVLVRKGREFGLEAPVATRADRAQVEELLEALRRARSSGFVTDAPSDLAVYGLEPAAATLVVTGGGVERTVLVGDTVSIGAQDRFALVSGTRTVVRVPAATLASMLPRVERVIDPVAAGVRAADVGAIEIARGAERVSIRREVSGWTGEFGTQGAAGTAGVFDGEAVDRLLAALTATRAGSIQMQPLAPGAETATVTLRGFAGEPLDTVRVVVDEAQGRTAFENGDGVQRVHGAIDLPIAPDALGFKPGVTKK
jgi:hypothetical protein